MSKGTIGTFVGAAIGFVITGGNPAGAQVGAMLGGAIGSSFDTIPGRKVGEMSSPRAQEGEPIPWVCGSARVTGRLMSVGEPDIRTESESGKGGPKVENETAYLSYSILIAESSELRDSTINGILMVIENNEIVYDVRATPSISAADSAKWIANKIFYFGGETQGVDPTEEMIHGVGNVPAYRGLCRMVVTDEDVTQHGGSIPTYEFVTSQCGVEEVPQAGVARYMGRGINPSGFRATTRGFDAGGLVVGTDDVNIGVLDDTEISAAAIHGGDVYVVESKVGVTNSKIYKASRSDLTAWTFLADRVPSSTGFAKQIESIGGSLWLTDGPNGLIKYDGLSTFTPTGVMPGSGGVVGSKSIWGVTGSGSNIFCCNNYATIWRSSDGGASFSEIADLFWRFSPDRFYTQSAIAHSGSRLIVSGWSDGGPVAVYSDDNGATWSDSTFSHAPNVAPYELKWCGGSRWVIACNGQDAGVSYYFASEDNGATFNKITLPQNIMASNRNGMVASDSISGEVIVAGVVGGVNYMFMSADLVSWETLDLSDTASTAIYELYPAGASIPYTPPEGAEELPDAPGHYVDPDTGEVTGPTTVIEDTCPPITLQEIIDKLDARAGIPIANSVTTALDGITVPGYAIDTFATVAEAKEPLRRVYFFDCPEYDDAIRYRLRGGATDFTIDPDDLIVGEDAIETGVRGQTVEFPKRLHVQYVDPETGYKPMKQTAERISPDIRVKGEEVASANITISADTAKQAADIGLKVAWTAREDSREIVIPMDYLKAIPSDCFSLSGRRYRIVELRIEAGAIYIKSEYDRISAYSSSVIGTVGPVPTGSSNLSGPTVSAIMNLPVLRDADDKAGIYWAASGLLTTWPGAQLKLARDGVTFENGPTVTQSATMGELTAGLASASRYEMDDLNTLSVRLTQTSGVLNSTDYQGLIEGDNAAAILYADGTCEIVQFQTAIETTPRNYDLTGLLRGRKDTVVGAHLTGAQFVLLNNNIRFTAIRADDRGQLLTFRGVTVGTETSLNQTQTITMNTIESLREWQPYNVTVDSDGAGGYCVEWIGRGRLGTSRTPVYSQWFDGYRVTFTIGTVVHTVDTPEQAICVDAATMLDTFGEGYGFPAVTVRARSKVATNDDDFDSPPGPASPGEGWSNEIVSFSGTFPGGWVGVPYILRNGDNGIVVAGGGYDANAYGKVCPGVCVSGDNGLSAGFRAVGIPHTAGTANCDVIIDGASPLPGYSGTVTVAHSVTIAAKPTFSPVDMTFRPASGAVMAPATVPWSTWDIDSGYSLHSYGVTSGKCVAEFTVGASTYPVYVGINAAKGDLTTADSTVGIGAGQPNTASVQTTGAAVYRVELNCSTGNWEVFKAGVSMTTGTLALPGGNQYRFTCTNENAQSVQVKCNFGIEAWVGTPTATYVGVPMPTIVIPCGFEAPSPLITAMMMTGDGYRGVYRGYKRNSGDTHVAKGGLGKSTGQWRVSLGGGTRQGMCVASFVRSAGLLGAAGTADSVGWDGFTLHWCLSGVYGSVPMRMPIGTLVPIFALDADTDVLRVCAGETVLHALTLPAGLTWFPAECDAYPQTTITYNPASPAGYNDWTLTV